jgi:hypothetical protein
VGQVVDGGCILRAGAANGDGSQNQETTVSV